MKSDEQLLQILAEKITSFPSYTNSLVENEIFVIPTFGSMSTDITDGTDHLFSKIWFSMGKYVLFPSTCDHVDKALHGNLLLILINNKSVVLEVFKISWSNLFICIVENYKPKALPPTIQKGVFECFNLPENPIELITLFMRLSSFGKCIQISFEDIEPKENCGKRKFYLKNVNRDLIFQPRSCYTKLDLEGSASHYSNSSNANSFRFAISSVTSTNIHFAKSRSKSKCYYKTDSGDFFKTQYLLSKIIIWRKRIGPFTNSRINQRADIQCKQLEFTYSLLQKKKKRSRTKNSQNNQISNTHSSKLFSSYKDIHQRTCYKERQTSIKVLPGQFLNNLEYYKGNSRGLKGRYLLRLRGGSPIFEDIPLLQVPTPIDVCQDLMDEIDQCLKAFKNAIGPCGSPSCPYAANVTSEVCRRVCSNKPIECEDENSEYDEYAVEPDSPLLEKFNEPGSLFPQAYRMQNQNDLVNACGVPTCPHSRQPDESLPKRKPYCRSVTCPYARKKFGKDVDSHKLWMQQLGPTLGQHCGQPRKCPYPVSLKPLPPIHWECPEALPEGTCKNPHCPYTPKLLRRKMPPCGNLDCPHSSTSCACCTCIPTSPCKDPTCPNDRVTCFPCPPQPPQKIPDIVCENPKCPKQHDKTSQYSLKTTALCSCPQSSSPCKERDCPFRNGHVCGNLDCPFGTNSRRNKPRNFLNGSLCDSHNNSLGEDCKSLPSKISANNLSQNGTSSSAKHSGNGVKENILMCCNSDPRKNNANCNINKHLFDQKGRLKGGCDKNNRGCGGGCCGADNNQDSAKVRASTSCNKCSSTICVGRCSETVHKNQIQAHESTKICNEDTCNKQCLSSYDQLRSTNSESCINKTCSSGLNPCQKCNNKEFCTSETCSNLKCQKNSIQEIKEYVCTDPCCPWRIVCPYCGPPCDPCNPCPLPPCEPCPQPLCGTCPCYITCPPKPCPFSVPCPFENPCSYLYPNLVRNHNSDVVLSKTDIQQTDKPGKDKYQGGTGDSPAETLLPPITDTSPQPEKTLPSSTKPASAKETLRSAQEPDVAKENNELQSKRKKSRKFAYFIGDKYPGNQVGHNTCIIPGTRVPPRMGWLWNIHVPCLQLQKRRGWKPGLIGRTIAARIQNHWMKKGLKSLTIPHKGKKRRKIAQSSGLDYESSSDESVPPQSTLQVRKRKGTYWITMHPLKDPYKIADNEIPYMDCTPMQFKITQKEKRECFCNEEEEEDKTESELDIDFTPPAGIIRPERLKKKRGIVQVETQYDPADFEDTRQVKIKKSKKDKKGKTKKEKKGKKK